MVATYAGTAQLMRFMGYDSTTNPYSNTQLQEALDRAETEVNKRTGTFFLDGTATTPTWGQKTDEKHVGKGDWNSTYFLDKYPLPDISTTVSGTAVGTADTSIYVASNVGFPTAGSILIETDRIYYTGKTGTSTLTGVTGVSAAHGTGETVTPHVIEISFTDVGTTPTWRVLELDKDVDIDLNSGKVTLFESSVDISATTSWSRFPRYQLPNRFRATYCYGWDTIPTNITRLCLMIASRDLMHSAVRKAAGLGMDNFSPELIDVDNDWIEKTIAGYKSIKMQNL